jgi:alpha-beta hydrolase superfamily lysophospholipase
MTASRLRFRDPLLDGQLLRTIGHCTYGGAELGECLAAADTIDPRKRDSWLAAWTALADRTLATGDACAKAGDLIGARRAYLRASNYFRNAYVLHLEAPLPAAAIDAYRRHRDAFERARVAEPIAIPFEDGVLPGYFCAATANARRPVVISVGGYDSTAEESYFWNAVAANERGYHAVTFDGPGQGSALFERGLTFRPDWSGVISAVIDAIVRRPDVDPDRIVVWGESFGGYLVPRAAARDRRIAACVLDPAQLGLFRAVLARLPLPASVKAQLPHGPRWAVAALRLVLARRVRSLTGGWALRRGMLTHGVATPWDYLVDTARYEQADVIPTIACPTLVCDAADDDISASSREFFELLACDKGYLRFTAAEGAGAHCVSGARALLHARAFEWLSPRLAGAAVARSA